MTTEQSGSLETASRPKQKKAKRTRRSSAEVKMDKSIQELMKVATATNELVASLADRVGKLEDAPAQPQMAPLRTDALPGDDKVLDMPVNPGEMTEASRTVDELNPNAPRPLKDKDIVMLKPESAIAQRMLAGELAPEVRERVERDGIRGVIVTYRHYNPRRQDSKYKVRIPGITNAMGTGVYASDMVRLG